MCLLNGSRQFQTDGVTGGPNRQAPSARQSEENNRRRSEAVFRHRETGGGETQPSQEFWKQQEAACGGLLGLMDWTPWAAPVKLTTRRSCRCAFIRKYFDSKCSTRLKPQACNEEHVRRY